MLENYPKHYCGLFGIFGCPEASSLIYLGLYALQHRGEESCGIVTSDGDELYIHKDMGLVVEASIYFFGYSSKIPFGQMPKINVRLGVLSYSVYDQKKRLEQGVAQVSRSSNEVTITVPLKLLGYPQKILTSARTSLGNFPLDNASWVVVDFQ